MGLPRSVLDWIVVDEGGFFVVQDAFQGTLSELAYALRTGDVGGGDIDLVELVRSFLTFFERVAARDLASASEALPQVAQIVELKIRLLLPHPPAAAEEEEPLEEEVLRVVLELEKFEGAVDFLRGRRDRRRLLLPARTEPPVYARPEPPVPISVGRLASLASRFRLGAYFEVAVERFSLVEAMRQLARWLSGVGRGGFRELVGGRGWAVTTILFAGLLELIREGQVRARQAEPFGPIELERCELEQREVA